MLDLEPLPHVEGNESRLVQVLVNLLVNASQAIADAEPQDQEIRIVGRLAPGDCIRIDVHDTGGGMSIETQAQVFDPPFSTKAVGEGTGLGLSVSHGIISAMRGEITVHSQLGRGSVFSIRLPVRSSPRPKALRTLSEPPPSRLRQRALVVDDEPLVRSYSIARALRQFDVTIITDARQVLPLLEKVEPFDLILCDLMMPELSGMALLDMVQAKNANQARRFIFMTGGRLRPPLSGLRPSSRRRASKSPSTLQS